MNPNHIYKPGDIVLHQGAPAKVITVQEGKPTITLKLAHNHYKTVLLTDVKPYEGEEDEVSLGLE